MMKFWKRINSEVPNDDSTHLEDRLFIYGLIRSLKPEICVEVGTHKGLTALCIAQALHENGKGMLVTCDPFDYRQEDNFRKFPQLHKRIIFKKEEGESLNVRAFGEIGFLFIDGFHQKEPVLAEIKNLFPQLSDKAVVLFHDSGGDVPGSVGVNAAIEEAGIKTILLPTKGRMHLYSNFEL